MKSLRETCNYDLDLEFCPECKGEIIKSSFEITCKSCGLVLGAVLEHNSYIFDDKIIKPNFNKQYVALGDRTDFIGSLGTFIGYENSKYLRDKSGKLLPPEEQKLYRRLKKNYSHLIRIKNHETEYRVLNVLSELSLYLNLNKNIRNMAAYYYKKIIKNEKKVINNISLIAFCIFYAARKENHNAPISIKEISEAFQKYGHRVNARLILRDALKYKHHLSNNSIPHMSEHYIIRLVSDVINYNGLEKRLEKKGSTMSKKDYQMNLIKKCQEILKSLPMSLRGGRNPFIMAGGTLYTADVLLAKEFNHKPILTQKFISESTKIAEYSIRDHYIKLFKPVFVNSFVEERKLINDEKNI